MDINCMTDSLVNSVFVVLSNRAKVNELLPKFSGEYEFTVAKGEVISLEYWNSHYRLQHEKQTVVIPFSLREQFNIANVIRFVQKTQDNFKEEK